MTIEGKTVLVTGGNRGIGQALVDEALKRGAERVYAGSRQPLAHPDPRVKSVTLDVTDQGQIEAAVETIDSLDVLINNAGVALYDDLTDRVALEHSLAVNLFGPWGVSQAFLPLLTESRGAIVNNVSLMALAPLPLTPAYAVSKAAAFNMTQSLRALLAGRGISVHAVLTGPTDTDMTRASRSRRQRLSPSRAPSSMGSRPGTRTSSRTRCRRRWPTAGATVRSRRSSARARRSSRHSLSRREDAEVGALGTRRAPTSTLLRQRHEERTNDSAQDRHT